MSESSPATPEHVVASTPTPAPAPVAKGWHFWSILTSLSIASLLAGMDATSVTTAMPSIVEDLGTDYAFYIWIANAYLLTMTAFQPIYGQTANIFGRAGLTVAATVLFAVGSAICWPASNMAMLVAGRAVQGVGAGGLNVMVEMIVSDLLPLRERGKYMGFIFAIYSIGVALGPVIGGVLADRVSWRWIFFLNLPVAAVALAALLVSLRVLPKGQAFRGTGSSTSALQALYRVDFASNALLVAAMAAVLLALTWGGVTESWSSWRTVVPLVLGLLGLGAYVGMQAVVKEPTMPLHMFRNRTASAGFALTFLHHVLIYWTLFVLPVYFQAVRHASPTISGVDLLPTAVVTMPFAILSGALLTKTGRYRPLLFAGFALLALAFGFFTMLGADSSTAHWAVTQVVGAAGIGLIMTTTLPCIMASLPEADVAVAAATWGFLRGFGAIWGVAIPSAIFNSRVDVLVAARLGSFPAVQAQLTSGGAYALASQGGSERLLSGMTGAEGGDVDALVEGVYVDSLKLCWQVGLGFALLGFLVAFVPREVGLRTELETEYGIDKGEKARRSRGSDDEESASSTVAVGRETGRSSMATAAAGPARDSADGGDGGDGGGAKAAQGGTS